MHATTLSTVSSLLLKDSPPFRAGVGLEMLSPGGYTMIIYRVDILSTIYLDIVRSRTLASLRDSLLPKLMRGEVRVSEL